MKRVVRWWDVYAVAVGRRYVRGVPICEKVDVAARSVGTRKTDAWEELEERAMDACSAAGLDFIGYVEVPEFEQYSDTVEDW
jgi:hypothetical protein